MRWTSSPVGICCYIVSLLAILVDADADFYSVRLRGGYNDMSGRRGDPPQKYWHESIFHPHYDGRFTDRVLPVQQQRGNLSLLVRSYMSCMADLGAETWISHGTLLGWYWTGKILPWDSDLDVQMSIGTLHFLAQGYNMTFHEYDDHLFLLEINPHYPDSSFDDSYNVIDARWIDTSTGLFIDITACRSSPEAPLQPYVMTKDRHVISKEDLFPLRQSRFEEITVLVPYDYVTVLEQEYGPRALTRTVFNGYSFDLDTKAWRPTI